MIVFDGNEDERDWLIRDANGTIVTGRDFAARHPTVRIDDLARNDDLPGPQLLAARLEAGWTPSNQTPIVYRPRPRTSYARPASVGPCTLYFVLFGTKADASAFGGALETSDDTEVDVPDYDQDGVWEVRIERRGYVDRAFEDELDARRKDSMALTTVRSTSRHDARPAPGVPLRYSRLSASTVISCD